MFYNETKTLYRGVKDTCINLLPFNRLKGKIIVFSAFTSISKNEEVAKGFSSRNKIEEIYKNYEKKRFSIIYIIKNCVKKLCSMCC